MHEFGQTLKQWICRQTQRKWAAIDGYHNISQIPLIQTHQLPSTKNQERYS